MTTRRDSDDLSLNVVPDSVDESGTPQKRSDSGAEDSQDQYTTSKIASAKLQKPLCGKSVDPSALAPEANTHPDSVGPLLTDESSSPVPSAGDGRAPVNSPYEQTREGPSDPKLLPQETPQPVTQTGTYGQVFN